MTRHPSTAVLVLLAILLLCGPAIAQDATRPSRGGASSALGEPAPASLEEEKPVELAAVVGEKVEIQVRPGVVLKGVVKDYRFEVLTPEGSYAPVESDEVPGAGIRVYYAMGLDGFIFLRYDAISEISFHGKLSQEEGLALARRIHEEMKRAEEERQQAIADMEARRAKVQAEKEARAAAATATAAREEVQVEDDRSSRIKALLERFPPPEWRPARLAELKKRALILDIYPNEEETAFIDNYELWFEGYEIWRKAQEELGKSVEPPVKK